MKKISKIKARKALFWVLLGMLAAVFIFSAFMIFRHFYDARRSAGQFEQLTDLTEQTQPETPQATEPSPKEKYASVLAQNEDFVGWIKIPDTRIDYPVVQTPHSPNYYLRRGFDKKYSYYGVPYAAEHCDVYTSDNVVIYGHNMNNGSMFSDLEKYRSQSFYEGHRYITFDTLEEFGTYEIIAVFQTAAGAKNEFKYFIFDDGNAEEFNAYVKECKARSLYSIDASAQDGDRLITLSTCEYTRENGRLVVVAKKIA